jgi:hypothetical protein
MELGRECGQRGGDALVGARVAGEPGDDLQVGQGGKGLGERRLGACQVLWEIEQHRPRLCRGRGLFADQYRRCDEEVAGVVPPWLERGEGLAMKADNVLDEAGGGPEAREGGVGHVAQGRHRQAERTRCGGMPGNALEDSGVGVQALTDGCRGHRARRGASAFRGQGRGGDLLGEAGKCGEVDARNAVALVCQAARQESASDDTRDVVRHQHRHGSHRIVTLDLCYRCSQGLQGRPTVRRCRHLNGQGGTPLPNTPRLPDRRLSASEGQKVARRPANARYQGRPGDCDVESRTRKASPREVGDRAHEVHPDDCRPHRLAPVDQLRRSRREVGPRRRGK